MVDHDNDDDQMQSSASLNQMSSASFIPGQAYGSDSTLGNKPKVIVHIQQQQQPQPESLTKQDCVWGNQPKDSATSLMSVEEIFQADQTQIYNSIQDYYSMLKNSYAASLARKNGDGQPWPMANAVDSFHRQDFTEFVVYYKLGDYFIRPMGVFNGKMAFEMQSQPYRVRRSSGHIDWIPYLSNDVYVLADHNYVTRSTDRQQAVINNMLILPQPKATVHVLGESYRGFWFSHPSNLELKGQISLARMVDQDCLVEERIRWNSVVLVLEGRLVVLICDYKSLILLAEVDCRLKFKLMDEDQPDRTEELEINGKDLSEPNDNLQQILNVLHKRELHSTSSFPIIPKRRSPRSWLEEQAETQPEQPPMDDGQQQQQQQQQKQQAPEVPSPSPPPEPPPPPPPKPKIPKYLGKDIKLPALPKPLIIDIAAKMAQITDSIRKQQAKYAPSWSPGLRPKSKPSLTRTRISKYGRKRSKSDKRKKSPTSPKSSSGRRKSGKTSEPIEHGSAKKSEIPEMQSKTTTSTIASSSDLSTIKTDPSPSSEIGEQKTKIRTDKKKSKSKSSRSSSSGSKSTKKSKIKSKSGSRSRKRKSIIRISVKKEVTKTKSGDGRLKSRMVSALQSLANVSQKLYTKSGKIKSRKSTDSKSKSLLKLPLKKNPKSWDSSKRHGKTLTKLKWSSQASKSASSMLGSKSKSLRKYSMVDGDAQKVSKKKTLSDSEKDRQQQSFFSRSLERLRETARFIFGGRASVKSRKVEKSLRKREISLSKSMSGSSKQSNTDDSSLRSSLEK